jgi:TM2 domain-containing membrane protein YozV
MKLSKEQSKMIKKSKVVAYAAAFLSGSVIWQGCLSDIGTGLFRRGFINNWWIDAFTDYLQEDLFG